MSHSIMVGKLNYLTVYSFTEVSVSIRPGGVESPPNPTLFDHFQFSFLYSITALLPIIWLII